MKRILITVISIIMLVSLVVPVSAEEQGATISEEEAKELIQKSMDFYYNVRFSSRCYDLTQSQVFPVFIQYEANGKIHTIEKLRYHPAFEEKLPGGSYEAMCNYAETIYVKDVAAEAYKYGDRIAECWGECSGTFFPDLFREEDGVLYVFRKYNPDFWFGTYAIGFWKGFELNNIEGDMNTAKASVSVMIWYGNDVTIYVPSVPVECIFQNTDDGWRIAKSDFSTMMATDAFKWIKWPLPPIPEDPDDAPSTGDTAGERVAVLGAVSLACIIPAACLTFKKRRRIAVD